MNSFFLLFVVGYWPSYNVPFYPVIYNLTGTAKELNLHNNAASLSYQVAARAKIFRRDQGNVVDMKSMQKLMRYNGTCFDVILSSLSIASLIMASIAISVSVCSFETVFH